MLLESPGHVYGLSYHFSEQSESEKKPPELVVSLSRPSWEELDFFMRTHPVTEHGDVASYLTVPAIASWDLEEYQHGGDVPFGLNGCGRVVVADGTVEIVFPLASNEMDLIVKSLQLLLVSLDASLLTKELERKVPSGNRPQLLMLTTRCAREFVYGHAVHGSAFPAFRKRLITLASKEVSLDGILAAMQDAHYALRPFKNAREEREYRKLMDYCFGANITDDGRFLLVCPGNACDLAIYPDLDLGPDYRSDIGCHNLDTALQQLTLLAGLASLVELAEKEGDQ